MIQVFTDSEKVGDCLQHEYDIIDFGEIKALKSAGASWFNPGDTVLKVKDTGNECIFKLEKFKLRLTYAQAHELYILLGYMNETKIEIRESTVMKSI